MEDRKEAQKDRISNVHARHQKYDKKTRHNSKSKTYNVVVKKKPRRTQRVRLQRGYGNKVQKVYITY